MLGCYGRTLIFHRKKGIIIACVLRIKSDLLRSREEKPQVIMITGLPLDDFLKL
jgi:hypothetical protein